MLIAVFSLQEHDFGTVLYVCLPGDEFDHGTLGRKKLGFARVDNVGLEAALAKLPKPRRIDLPFSSLAEDDSGKVSLSYKIKVDGTDPTKLITTFDSAKDSPVLPASLAYLVSGAQSTGWLSSIWGYFFGA